MDKSSALLGWPGPHRPGQPHRTHPVGRWACSQLRHLCKVWTETRREDWPLGLALCVPLLGSVPTVSESQVPCWPRPLLPAAENAPGPWGFAGGWTQWNQWPNARIHRQSRCPTGPTHGDEGRGLVSQGFGI